MDDFYFAETPNCSQVSQNSQVSANSLTVDTNFDSDSGHTSTGTEHMKVKSSAKLVDGIASSSSSSSSSSRNGNYSDNISDSTGSDSSRNGIVDTIADMSENSLFEKIENVSVPDQLYQRYTTSVSLEAEATNNLLLPFNPAGAHKETSKDICYKSNIGSQDAPLSPGLDAIWAAVKIVMPPAYEEHENDVDFEESIATASRRGYRSNDQLIADTKGFKTQGTRKYKSRTPKPPLADSTSSRSPSKARNGMGTEGNEPGVLSCNCRKTRCLKMYCDCFRFKKYCHKHCNCTECANLPEHETERLAVMAAILERNPDAFKPKGGHIPS